MINNRLTTTKTTTTPFFRSSSSAVGYYIVIIISYNERIALISIVAWLLLLHSRTAPVGGAH